MRMGRTSPGPAVHLRRGGAFGPSAGPAVVFAMLFLLAAFPSAATPAGALRPAMGLKEVPRTIDAGAPTPRPAWAGPLPDSASSGRSEYSGHYYAGTDFAGPFTYATNLSVDLQVPQDQPQSGDFYYVILSTWDTSNSYDQLGFTNSNGTWGVAYSVAINCASTYEYSADAYPLSPGTNYRFDMSLASGDVDFTVSVLGGAPVFSTEVLSGGANTTFALDSTYSCDGGSSYDYTDYEEVYDTTAPVPPYSFDFQNNSEDGSPAASWTPWESSGAPSSIAVSTSGSSADIENVPFEISAAPTLASEIPTSDRNYTENGSVKPFSSDGLLTVSEAGTIANSRVSVSPTTGTAPFTFVLSVELTPASPTESGVPVELEVTDSHGVYARLLVDVEIDPALVATVPVPRPSAAEVGRPLLLTEAPVGGSGSYAFDWSGLPAGCAGGNATVACDPSMAGGYSISVVVNDSLGFSAGSSLLRLTVFTVLELTVSANRSDSDVGQAVQFTAIPIGGSGGESYSWSYGSGATCTPSGPTLSCLARSAGVLTATASATDASGGSARASTTTSLYSDPVATLSAAPSVSEVGRPVTLVLGATGGYLNNSTQGGPAAYGFAWTGLPANCSAPAASSYRCTWSRPGSYPVTASITDSDLVASTTADVTVLVYPNLSIRLVSTSSNPVTGQTIELGVVVSGGLGPFEAAWSGLPPGCSPSTGANLTCTIDASGTYPVHVTVSDHAGGNATASTTLTVQPGFLGVPATEGYAGIGLGLAAAAAIAGFLLKRRRRRPKSSGEPGTSRGTTPPPRLMG